MNPNINISMNMNMNKPLHPILLYPANSSQSLTPLSPHQFTHWLPSHFQALYNRLNQSTTRCRSQQSRTLKTFVLYSKLTQPRGSHPRLTERKKM